MFEDLEHEARLAKREYRERLPAVRTELLRVQYELREADFACVVVLAGNDLAGLHDQINVLHEWLDARLLDAYAFTARGEHEAAKPELWRYWKAAPARGRTAIFLGGWTQRRILAAVRGELNDGAFERALAHDASFERSLVEDGTLLLKLWLHLPLDELRSAAKEVRKEPSTLLYRPSLELFERPEKGLAAAGPVLTRSNTDHAPWHLIAGGDVEHRRLEVARILSEALDKRLREGPPGPLPPLAKPSGAAGGSKGSSGKSKQEAQAPAALAEVDLSAKLGKKRYWKELEELQTEAWRLSCEAIDQGVSMVLAFEGWDAAGKGGTIRRLTRALPATSYRVIAISAPTDEELARPWQWRFWRELPGPGRTTIFDRSWYGRVLVERVEGFASEPEWRRAYGEIVDFEQQLVETGVVLRKFWLHLSPEEQLARFEARADVPFKKYKLTADDFRNRARWDEYAEAVDEMVARTSEASPWHLVSSEDKRHARVAVLREVVEALEERLG